MKCAKGQVVGFLGPNGAGKSTTLRMLTCYLPPTSGGATVNGFDIFHQSEQVRETPRLSARKRPALHRNEGDGVPRFPRPAAEDGPRRPAASAIDYVIERCWLSGVRNRVIGHLSKGYRQRVGLADSLLHNPAVLILDEPTVGLDPTQIIETRKLIKDLGGDHTLILSTHILPEVEAVCDRAIVIAGGRIVAQGSPDELRASRRMQARVLVECKGPGEQVKNALAARQRRGEGRDPDRQRRGGRQYVTAAVRPKESYDVREEVARTIQQNGWPLREIRLEHATLEEFFVQVTANQAVGQGASSATPPTPAPIERRGCAMSRAPTIARRELSSYFYSPIAYVALTLFLVVCGFLFYSDFQPGQPAGMRNIFDYMVWLLVFIVPVLCMGLLAQEWATGTIETLMTAPVGETDVVIGKFLGALGFFVVLLLPTLLYVVLLQLYGHVDCGPISAATWASCWWGRCSSRSGCSARR